MISTTTVRLFKRCSQGAATAAGLMLLASLLGLVPSSPLSAQTPKRHWLHNSALPPGAIGSQRLLNSRPLSGYTQPVELLVPDGVTVSAVTCNGVSEPRGESLLAGLLVGPVYRFQAQGVQNYESVNIYPTVEVIGRLYPPTGKELRFPIPVELTREELQLAAAGSFVTRVIYVEDPAKAIPVDESLGQQWFEARCDQDPLVVADTLGRPVAILRIGSRLPGEGRYNDPPMQLYDRQVAGSGCENSDCSEPAKLAPIRNKPDGKAAASKRLLRLGKLNY